MVKVKQETNEKTNIEDKPSIPPNPLAGELLASSGVLYNLADPEDVERLLSAEHPGCTPAFLDKVASRGLDQRARIVDTWH